MTATTDPQPAPFRLLPSIALACIAAVAALVFASTFNKTPDAAGTHTPPPPKAHHNTADESAHAGHAAMHYAGGFWSPENHTAGLAELAAQAIFGSKLAVCQSIAWHEGNLIVTDVTPLRPPGVNRDTDTPVPTIAVVSIDYTGSEIPVEFAVAIQKHVADFQPRVNLIHFITPLPGPDPLPKGQDAYDWTFLAGPEGTAINFVQPASLEQNTARQAVTLWVQDQATLSETSVNTIGDPTIPALLDLTLQPGRNAINARRLLAFFSPYLVMPALQEWLGQAEAGSADRERRVFEALRLTSAMYVHADDLIAEAAASDNPQLRAQAARTIGDLADLTTDPIALLTVMAEDKSMAVRYEALAACRAVPGRRAAGVAQLVESRAMSDQMLAFYNAVMSELLAYGEPVQADSYEIRIRRMPIKDALVLEREAVVCRVLLERTDLPDEQINPLLADLAKANGSGPLTSLLNLLETMNPRIAANRQPLLETLAEWKTNELEAQSGRLIELIQQAGRPDELKSAAAGALIRALSDPDKLKQATQLNASIFSGLAWVGDADVLNAWAATTAAYATGKTPSDPETQIAALDALRYLPAEAITGPTIADLLTLARAGDLLDLRFAAIRAINMLPASKIPGDIDDLKLTTLTLEAVPGKIAYDKTTLTAPAGRPVELKLINPDTMEHNLAITRPGQAQLIGLQITAMNPSDAAAIGYIPPDNDAVLHHTPMLKPGMTYTLRFIAPADPGKYEYVCTFPGHYTTMRGVLEVVQR